ncbi:gem-associated protein 4 [Trichomycterus rosablanca]|uniref:gem-associated protein 4 n=1 Tax=Trichomycterus rosablanca TaxID=2290929 RepID=UPI002F3530EA
MEQESWLSSEKTTVLQGGFLLANQLCHPESLSTLKKNDWTHIGKPIVQAVTEICEQLCVNNQDGHQWRKRVLCILWSKILEYKNEENLDIRWRENPLFAVQNSLPSINHTLMFELIKSMGFFSIYVELLQCFEPDRQCKELERLVKHVTSETTEADVKFLLEVWWELMRGRREAEDNCDQMFAANCVHLIQRPPDCSSQASKRFKPDPDLALSTTCIVSILFQALKDIKENINSSELCFFALSNCLDMLYTNFLLDHPVIVPVEVKLQNIAHAVSLRKRNNLLEEVELTQAILESLRDLSAILSPAQSKPSGITLIQAMQTALEIICAWDIKGLLIIPTNDQSALLIRLKDSLCRVLKSMNLPTLFENLNENKQTINSLKKTLEDLQTLSLSFTVPTCPASDMAKIAVAIMDGSLNGFQDLPKLCASNMSHVFQDTEEWLSCIERNKSKFQRKDLVMALVASLITKFQSNASVNHCKKLKDITVDIFSQLPLPEKNAAISDVLAMSNKGLHGFLTSPVIAGFDEELNLAFNCIIQSDAKSSLSSAVFAVARVAFQNPEATMRRCCHMAVVNLGAHTLLAQILQQLSGLSSSFRDCTGTIIKEQDLLCRCLQDTVWNKLSSHQEEDQFLCFLTALMEPNIYGQNGEKLSFLPPEKAVRAFVLPYLSSISPKACSFELCLRLLQSALAHTSVDNATQWIMNCSPFALLYCLAQLLNNCSRCWEQPLESEIALSFESKELLISVLTVLGKTVGQEVALAPGTWSRAISWLYEKVEELDWTVRFHLKVVWGEHFKFEVPSSLMAVCDLSEWEWSALILPQYGQGTGLLAWIECCCLSDHIQDTMLDSLSLNLHNSEDVSMFSKGLLVAVTQVLPWCTASEWVRLLKVLHELLQSDKLYVPYSIEYVDYLPLLDLYSFACDLRMSVFLLRIFQLLCGCSCADWLPLRAWAHVGRLYATAVRGIINSLKDKVPLQSTTTSPNSPTEGTRTHSKEVLFVMTQLYCHVLHVQVMIPGQPEPLFLCALDILSHYEAVLAAYPKSSTALQIANTKHFLTTITDNLQCRDMKHVLHQKIAGL